MRLLIVVACLVSAVCCGSFMESTADRFSKWSKFKALESCIGEEVTRNYILKLKKAHAKCQNVELAPEAQLENSQSSTKFIKALLDGSAQQEKETLAKLKDALGFHSPPAAQPYGYPYPVVLPYQQKQAESGDEMFELMKKFMLKRFLKKYAEDDDEFGKIFGKNVRTRRDDEEVADVEVPEEAAAADVAAETFDPEVRGLGERLNEKLTQEKAAFAAKLGNFSCVLQELKVVDKDFELNLDSSLEEIQNSGIKDQWFLDNLVEEKKKCYAKAQALPKEVLEGCVLSPKWVKVKEFMCCCKEAKMKTCMAYDTRKKLEANFGSVEKLKEQTGLEEKELYFLASKVLFESLDME